jgi:arginyl-tRNA synthetase
MRQWTMADPQALLLARLQDAFDTLEPGADPVLRDSDRADFQVNGTLPLAKRLGRTPHEVAEEIVAASSLDDLCRLEVSGPGFINVTLTEGFLADQVAALAGDERLGIARAETARTVVVDYSAPNVAKEMHVGHLRSTVIGDSLCRILSFAGHRVVRENHVGDWGTPFGMLIEHLIDLGQGADPTTLSVSDLDEFYRAARVSFDSDPAFADRARARVVLLQSGDKETLALWHALVAESTRHFDDVYAKLGVLLTDDDIVGESFYNPMLPSVVEDLRDLGLLVEDNGAQCVFPPGFTNREGQPLPLIVQKSDDGYGYAATDLAAIRDRVSRIGADAIDYVVGAPQSQHLEMCFAVARMAGWLDEGTETVHVSFGNVLGEDKKMFKTRSGTTVRLADLLDEAVDRARAALAAREGGEGAGAPDDDIARALGIGAVKYADLATERHRDYVFDWDRMLAFEGNTGPYLQYAHARICSILRRVDGQLPTGGEPPSLGSPHERALALALLGFNEAVQAALTSQSPSKICSYLYSLSSTFTSFYENCPVLKAPNDETRRSRLLLSVHTAKVLRSGLALLGMEAPDQM